MKHLMTILVTLSLTFVAGGAFAGKQDKVLINHKGKEIMVAASAVPHHLRNHVEDFVVGDTACEASRSVLDVGSTEFDAEFDVTYVICESSALNDLNAILEAPPVELSEGGVDYECEVAGDTPVLNAEFTVRLQCTEVGAA